ncbi:MAG: chemotaxis protein CheW [Acidobacteria bacterium]|nr:chemotaxis protein CheW [Acidobacteriota bacterium]
MKKRRKNNYQPQATSFGAPPAVPEATGGGASLQDPAVEEALSGDDDELLAQLLSMEAGAKDAATEESEPAQTVVDAPADTVLAPAEEFALDAAAGTQSGVAEPLDELLAELLALDMDGLSSADAPEAALETISEPVIAIPGEEASEAFDPEMIVEAPDSLPAFAAEADPAALITAMDDSLIEEPAEPLLAAQPLLAAEPELPHAQLLAAEPTTFEEPAMMEEAAWVEMPAFETSEMTTEPEEMIEPLPPQPALEAIVGTIDRALESAPAVIAPVEPSVAHHKQFSQLDDYIVFSLSGSDYAVPVRDVAEIGRIPSVTRIPNVPDFVRGITNLRGEVVPVLNLPGLLGLQDSAPTARGRIVFLQARDPISPTGLIVDEVKGMQRIQSQQLEQVTGLVDDKVTSVLRGVHGRGERLLNVLDLEQLFQLEEVRDLAAR